MEKTLWAVKIGDKDWQEQVITSTANTVHLNNAKEWARLNGFDRLRVSSFNINERPDFVKAVQGTKQGGR